MNIQDLKRVAVIGAGDMGHGIAQVALMAGYPVTLFDIKQEFAQRGRDRILQSLDKLCAKNKVDALLVEHIRAGALRLSSNLAEAVADADFIIEAVPEVLDIKLATFRDIDQYAPTQAIIASNTSTMSIEAFAQATSRPSQVIGTHYFNPAVLMRLVEVVCCRFTSMETARFSCDYVEKVGKSYILAKKDTPGFIANRIAAPTVLYTRLAMDVDGLTAEDIDIAMMRAGQKMGPMELADYSGIDVQNMCMRYYHKTLSEDYEICPTAFRLEQQGFTGKKASRGFYIWPEKGRPAIDEQKYTGAFDSKVWFFLEANEACKLVEDEICSFEDCDKAMELGYNSCGPIAYIQDFDPTEIATTLDAVAAKYGKNIFAPTKSIRSGAYLKKL